MGKGNISVLFCKSLFGGVLCLLLSLPVWAQPSNSQVYRQLIEQYLQKHPENFRKVSGQILKDYFPPYTTDSTATATLQVFLPDLSYTREKRGVYVRKMDLSINRKDSVTVSRTLAYQDTLNRKQLRHIIRNSPEELQGDNPTRWGKWIGPTVLISTSIAGIVSLFFLRSSSD